MFDKVEEDYMIRVQKYDQVQFVADFLLKGSDLE